jgi:hypothetical protein
MLERKNVLNPEMEKVTLMLLTGILIVIFISPLSAQSPPAPGTPTISSATRHYHPDPFAGRAGKYYSLVWGVDALTVKAVESGQLIRFSYEVLDPSKATTLNDKKLEPKLIAPDAKAILIIPSLEKVGQLRQSSTPEAGKSYWMAFSNPRRTVKRGDRVSVVIGQFHADGLVVE